MHPVLRWTFAIVGIVVTLAVLAPAILYLASEAVIQRRYPLASTTVPTEFTSKMVARGVHLLAIAGCGDCHGADLRGRLLQTRTALPLYAGNLRLDAKRLDDGDFERIIRYGIKPDATSLWGMPSAAYTYMSEDDVASIVAYLRTLGDAGAARPKPQFDWRARLAVLEGKVEPTVPEAVDSPASLDLGPRYDGGRYLARVTCGECHGTDLTGLPGVPNLKVISTYSRPAFFDLLRRGVNANGRWLPTMSRIARTRFHVFADYEIMALYDYLDASTRAPPDVIARAAALRRHAASEKALESIPR
jgi:mono/diheme cytochrome c family protein